MKSTHKATKEERIREQLWRDSKEVWSYQQARTWTLKYKELGEARLEDSRGKASTSKSPGQS